MKENQLMNKLKKPFIENMVHSIIKNNQLWNISYNKDMYN